MYNPSKRLDIPPEQWSSVTKLLKPVPQLTKEEALELIPHITPSSKDLKINDSILIKEPIKTDSDIQYYSCDWNGEDSVMTRDIILNKAKTQLAASFA